jgi:hypothetical protein
MDGTVNLFSRGGQKREILGLAVLLNTVQNFCPIQIFALVVLTVGSAEAGVLYWQSYVS